MTASTMLIDLTLSGIRLEARGERLYVEAKPGTITDELRRLLTENKAELLADLSQPIARATDLRTQLHCIAADAGSSHGTKPMSPRGLRMAQPKLTG